MKNPISDFTDELVELGGDVKKTFVRDVVKGIPQTAKQQVFSDKSNNGDASNISNESNASNKSDKSDKSNKDSKAKVDPVTGKPIPQKAQLQHLTQSAAQLRIAKLKQVREELEKQRLKVTDKKAELSPLEASKQQGMGPVVSTESAEKAPDNAVANTLKGSKNTGEFKGLVGG